MNVAVVGLGKLGSVLGAVLADAGHDVIGVDLNQANVDAINASLAPVDETDLAVLMASLSPGKFTATTDYVEGIPTADFVMIVVPTPSDETGWFNSIHVLEAIASIAPHLGHRWVTVVVCSTLMPGTMINEVRATLEEKSGRFVGLDVGLCYSPEFIALGSVIHDMTHPDMVLIGSEDERSGDELTDLLGSIVEEEPEFHRLNFANAELAKISVNAYVTMKISFANTVGMLCEKLTGGRSVAVLGAVGADSRIGRRYLNAGPSYGGPCFPRDTRAFDALGKVLDVPTPLAFATQRVNDHTVDRVFRAAVTRGGKVAILGLTYKAETSITEESMGTRLADMCRVGGVEVATYDAAVESASIEDTIQGANTIIITTPSQEFADTDFGGHYVIDCWGIATGDNVKVLGWDEP